MGSVHAKSIEKEEMDDSPSTKVDLQGLKAQVQRVHVNGIGRTKEDIVIKSIKEVFEANDFQAVIMKIHEARYKLENLGCFNDVGVLIDTYEGPDATKEGIEVTFDVEEKKMLGAQVNTSVGQNEGSVDTAGLLKNIFGRGEEFSLKYSYGSKKKTAFSANYVKPLHNDLQTKLGWSIYQHNYEMGWSGFKETDRGVLLSLILSPSPNVKQQLILESAWRHLSCMSKSTAFAVRDHSGHTLKNSIKHELSYDDRDDAIFPSDGTFTRIRNEIAGLNGNIGFLKNEISVQTSLPLFFNTTASTFFSAGQMMPLNNAKTYSITDRFILGGPMNFRGFQMGGIGPHSEGYALGAQAYWNAGIHVFSPLPLLPINSFTDRFRLQLWINVGNIGDWKLEEKNAVKALQNILFRDMRFTYGVGVALNLASMARLELNYCIPLHFYKGDRIQHGLQFGISAEVL